MVKLPLRCVKNSSRRLRVSPRSGGEDRPSDVSLPDLDLGWLASNLHIRDNDCNKTPQ